MNIQALYVIFSCSINPVFRYPGWPKHHRIPGDPFPRIRVLLGLLAITWFRVSPINISYIYAPFPVGAPYLPSCIRNVPASPGFSQTQAGVVCRSLTFSIAIMIVPCLRGGSCHSPEAAENYLNMIISPHFTIIYLYII